MGGLCAKRADSVCEDTADKPKTAAQVRDEAQKIRVMLVYRPCRISEYDNSGELVDYACPHWGLRLMSGNEKLDRVIEYGIPSGRADANSHENANAGSEVQERKWRGWSVEGASREDRAGKWKGRVSLEGHSEFELDINWKELKRRAKRMCHVYKVLKRRDGQKKPEFHCESIGSNPTLKALSLEGDLTNAAWERFAGFNCIQFARELVMGGPHMAELLKGEPTHCYRVPLLENSFQR